MIGITSIGIKDSSDFIEERQGTKQQAYLKQNHLDVIERLATGQGKFINDLKVLLKVPKSKISSFTRQLTVHYNALIKLADIDLLTRRVKILYS